MSHKLGVRPSLWRRGVDYQQPGEGWRAWGERERMNEGKHIQYAETYQIGEDELKVCLINLCHDI